MNSAFLNTYHFSNFMNFDSLNLTYQAFDSDTIFISVRCPWHASVFLWIIQWNLAIFKFGASQRHFLPAENGLAINNH
jgi:hypothetical protein